MIFGAPNHVTSLRALFSEHPGLASSATVAGPRDNFDEFCSIPAAGPSEREQGSTD